MIKVEERWQFPNEPQKGFLQLYWAHARWAREEINQSAGDNCALKRVRIFKRLDRLRHITAWQYCDKVDSNLGICKWAYVHKKGGNKENPRSQKWFKNKFAMNP